MWQCIIYFIVYIYSVNGKDNTNLLITDYGKTEPSKYNSIINCIITISDMTLFFRPTIVIIEQRRQKTKEDKFINELVDKLMKYNIPQVIFKDTDGIEENNELLTNSLIIAFFDTYDDVINFNIKRVTKKLKFLFIISDSSTLDWNKNLEKIGVIVDKYDVTFIVTDFVEDKNKIYTIFPGIDEKSCEEIINHPKLTNSCFNGTMQNREIFTVKNPVNLNKCPLRVGMANIYPFSTIKDKELLKNYDRIEEIKGFDFEMMKIISKYFNATLDLHYIYRTEENPVNDLDFLKFVLNESLDVCSGGLYRIYGNKFEYSGTYASQAVTWIYYAERADRSWENLIQKLNGLYIFIMFYIIYSLIWYIIRLFDRDAVSLNNTLLYSWGALVGATSLQDARSSKQKMLNLMYLIMCIYLSAYVSLQLYSFLTIRGPPRIFKTNDDIMTSGRTPILMPSTKYFVADEKYVKFANTSKDCLSFKDCAEQTLKHNGLTVYLQGIFYVFQAQTAVNDEARILRATENILTVYNEMLIRKNSPLVLKFQEVIRSLFEGGITQKLLTEAVGISVVAKANSANANMIANSYSCQAGCAITFIQFAGVFYIWISGCILSIIVFAVEIFMNRERKPVTPFD